MCKGEIMPNVELKGFKGLRELNATLGSSDGDISSLQENIMNVVPIFSLQRGKYQPRSDLQHDDKFQQLADSIRENGIIQPLIVRKSDEGKLDIIAGERRWQAAKAIGLKEIPVVICNVDDHVALAFSIVENIQRKDLNCVEEGRAFLLLKQKFNMTHGEIAQTVGLSRSSITNSIRLLSLETVIINLLENRELEMGHARALLSLPQEKQAEYAQKIIEKKTYRA
jgi:ParB family chromosome partitioning protein